MNRLWFDRQFPGPVLGIDEVGLGAIAGPITVCGCILPEDDRVLDILTKIGARDSKKISEEKRGSISGILNEYYVWHFICSLPADEYRAGKMSHHLDDLFFEVIKEAVKGPGFKTVIIDGTQDRHIGGFPFKAIAQADDKSLSVACASILAKVHRDKIMRTMGRSNPVYGFGKHKGYPTEAHLDAVQRYGPLPGIHRMESRPIRELIGSLPEHPEGDGPFEKASLSGPSAANARRFPSGSGRFH